LERVDPFDGKRHGSELALSEVEGLTFYGRGNIIRPENGRNGIGGRAGSSSNPGREGR
jgi:hypothetical protein